MYFAALPLQGLVIIRLCSTDGRRLVILLRLADETLVDPVFTRIRSLRDRIRKGADIYRLGGADFRRDCSKRFDPFVGDIISEGVSNSCRVVDPNAYVASSGNCVA